MNYFVFTYLRLHTLNNILKYFMMIYLLQYSNMTEFYSLFGIYKSVGQILSFSLFLTISPG